MRRLGAILAILFALPVLAQNQSGGTATTLQIDPLVQQTMTSWKVPGLAIAVVQNDRVVYLKALGVKEIGKDDPITPDTLFEIGSTSKAFTSTSLAMLADEKKLSWDDPVHKHVPYFHLSDPCADAMVTIRDIASHHTGLGTHDELWDFTLWPREQVLRSVATLPLTRPFRSAYI